MNCVNCNFSGKNFLEINRNKTQNGLFYEGKKKGSKSIVIKLAYQHATKQAKKATTVNTVNGYTIKVIYKRKNCILKSYIIGSAQWRTEGGVLGGSNSL